MSQQKIINVARGLEKAELVIKNANVVNVLSEEIHKADIAIQDGVIVGIGENYFGEKEIDVMLNQAKDVLLWYDNMKNPVPSWYIKT